MNLYPAIDLYEGEVVRLEKGDFSKKTVYSKDPASQAKEWEAQGSLWIHVVDLEGAKTGILKNLNALKQIREAVNCKIQFGGGLRTLENIQTILSLGINSVVIGTKALDEKFLAQMVGQFKSQIAVGLDAKDDFVQTAGWITSTASTLKMVLQTTENKKSLIDSCGVETVIYTDIKRDGIMEGPNFEGLISVLNWTKARVILSGGVSSLEDIEKCAALSQKNFEGAIIGKALYEKKFPLSAALERIQRERS
jgi:phosphoribosylformimino-5-aminoimidazole carboxamide ribotide isomerase